MNATTLTSNSDTGSASAHVPPSESRRLHDFREGPQYSPDGRFYRSGYNEAWTPVPPAVSAVPLTGAGPIPAKSRTVYVLLALLLGGLGVHNFYAGRVGVGVAQCAITLISLVTIFLIAPVIFILAVGFWAILDAICITHDGAGRRFT